MKTRSSQPTSGFSVRMPKTLRRKIRVAAGLDDMRVHDWVIQTLDHAAKERISGALRDAGVDLDPEGGTDEEARSG